MQEERTLSLYELQTAHTFWIRSVPFEKAIYVKSFQGFLPRSRRVTQRVEFLIARLPIYVPDIL